MTNNLPKIDTSLPAPSVDDKVLDWLKKQASAERPYLLAFADDGVIWGKWMDDELKTAPQALKPVKLRGETLQQAYVFGLKGEVRLFRDERTWKAAKIEDGDKPDALDEFQILWGDIIVENPAAGFTHLRDLVQQGMDQILPLTLTESELKRQAVRLQIRHFVTYEDTGEARIFLSRLVQIGLGPLDEEKLNEEMTK